MIFELRVQITQTLRSKKQKENKKEKINENKYLIEEKRETFVGLCFTLERSDEIILPK